MEGWGLPIGEALAYGKLPLVHRKSSIPEVGGELAVYCDINKLAVTSALIQIMQDESLRKRAARADLQKSLRTWDDVASDFLKEVNFEFQ
jgi:glycosyltransferase involved in cell wall biosynthesis